MHIATTFCVRDFLLISSLVIFGNKIVIKIPIRNTKSGCNDPTKRTRAMGASNMAKLVSIFPTVVSNSLPTFIAKIIRPLFFISEIN